MKLRPQKWHLLVVACLPLLGGCAVVGLTASAVGAAVDVTLSVVGATVDVTGAAVGGASAWRRTMTTIERVATAKLLSR